MHWKKIGQLCACGSRDAASVPCLPAAAFTTVMGTGALALATWRLAQDHPWLYWAASLLNILNFVLFATLVFFAVITWSRNREALRAHFEQPDQCALYGACGIALLVLGTQSLAFGFGWAIGIFFWTLGATLTLTFNFGLLLRFFLHPGVELEHVTPVLFVPVASMVVTPAAGAPIAVYLGGAWGELALLVSLVALGGGLMLYGGLFSLMLQRHLLLRPLPDQLLPTCWIHLAPIGWAGVALIELTGDACPVQWQGGGQMLALIFFGAALWWLIMAALLCLRAISRHKLAFSLSWWSFIFPIGSVAILSSRLDFEPARAIFPALWLLLASIWILCAIKTIAFLRAR